MDTIKYLCEFFFCNVWHWIGMTFWLMLIAACISSLFDSFKRN